MSESIMNTDAPKAEEPKRGRPRKESTIKNPAAAAIEAHDSLDVGRKSFGRVRRIDFSHITEARENAGYEFTIVHRYPSGNIERHMQRGWKLWEDKNQKRFFEPDEMDANRARDSYASIAVGAHPEGVQRAYLMFMPREQYRNTILKWHDENAKAQKRIVDDGRAGAQFVDPQNGVVQASAIVNIQNRNETAEETGQVGSGFVD